MTACDESSPVRPTADGALPVFEITPGIVTTGPWIESQGQWALFACEVSSQDGHAPVDLVIEAETRFRDEPDAAAVVLLPLSLDGGAWRVHGSGVHGAEFVRLRDLVRLRWWSRHGPLLVRMQPTRWSALPDGFVWMTPWIPRGPSSPARIEVSIEPSADGSEAGSGVSVDAWVVVEPEAP